LTFGRALLAGESVRDLKARPDYKRLHDQLTAEIHADDEEAAA
jgi:taurine transport system ATP-binding protein